MSGPVELPPPYFATASSASAHRRLLLISYFFTPINVIGAIRWHRMVQEAADRGWAVDVVMVDPMRGASVDAASTAAVDPDKLNELPPGVTIYQVPDQRSWWSETQRWIWRTIRPVVRQAEPAPSIDHSPVRPAHGNPFRPRAAYLTRLHYHDFNRWARDAARAALRIAAVRRPDVIVSSGPPHSAHEAARRLSVSLGIPWVMDMRDPWAAAEYTPQDMASRTWYRMTAGAEARCVRSARVVALNTEASRHDICGRYPDARERFITVMNGADPMGIPDNIRPAERFTMAYAGNIYVGRDPTTVFQGAARVIKELSLTPASIGVEFMGGGEFARSTVLAAAEQAGISEFVSIVPRRPHREALAFLARASVLIGLPQYAHLAIPAKVFEYVQFPAWLLILAEEGSATEVLFRGTGADVVNPSDVGAIAARIRERYEQFRRGERPVSLNADGAFDRSRQSRILFDAMERLR
jgi:hypothetical protein